MSKFYTDKISTTMPGQGFLVLISHLQEDLLNILSKKSTHKKSLLKTFHVIELCEQHIFSDKFEGTKGSIMYEIEYFSFSMKCFSPPTIHYIKLNK